MRLRRPAPADYLGMLAWFEASHERRRLRNQRKRVRRAGR
jgi:hypothetical protein